VSESGKPSEAPRGQPAVVLLSGGLDSTTVLAIAAREAGQRVHALSFAYGQRHVVELACAKLQAQRFDVVAHEVVDIAALGQLVRHSSSLVAASALEVPSAEARAGQQDIPSTYVPARNTLFLSYALAWAEVLGARDIWLGVNAVDYSGYPDCRPEFIDAFKFGIEGGDRPVRIHAPLIDLHKHEIIARGLALGVDYADTTSCYDPREREGVALACGRCESCSLRREGFLQAHVPDPTRYA
jgi:7-cyano-7-deazaguanine synthase